MKRSFCVHAIKGVPNKHCTNPRIYADSKPGLSNMTFVADCWSWLCEDGSYVFLSVIGSCKCVCACGCLWMSGSWR